MGFLINFNFIFFRSLAFWGFIGVSYNKAARDLEFITTLLTAAKEAIRWLLAGAEGTIATHAEDQRVTAARIRKHFAAMRAGFGGPPLYTDFGVDGIPTHDTHGCALEAHERAGVRKSAVIAGLLPARQNYVLL